METNFPIPNGANIVISEGKKKLRFKYYESQFVFSAEVSAYFLHSNYRHRKHEDFFFIFQTIDRFDDSGSVWLRHFDRNIVRN